MKYIRTKDGVYDTTKGLYTPSIKMFAIGTKTIYENQIIAQADTIEELCDEFVLVNKTKEIIDHRLVYDIDFSKDKFVLNKYEVFGAIWTDKGLIYVAKMNEKGELVLI